MTGMSLVPIIRDDWYDGAWFDRANGYVPYPMGFVVEEIQNKSYVMLSFSRLERHGYLAKVDLDELLASLVPVTSCSQ